MLATLPELILGAGALVLLMVAAWAGDRHTKLISWLSVVLVAAAGLSLFAPSSHVGVAFGGLYMADGYAAFAKALIYIAGAIAIIIAPDHFSRESVRAFDLRAEYPVLILLSLVGMGMMVSAIDLLTLYVGLELQSLASYVLAAFHRRDSRSTEAGLKYFVLGALASGILLYGISLLYGFTGTTSFTGIQTAIAANGLGLGTLFGLVFVLSGLAFKAAAVPFHMWTPDVYEGAPTPVTAFFASAPKVAAIALLVRVSIGALGPAEEAWRQIVIFSALASIVLGAVAAIGQTSIKRLLAYSSINNIGFVLIGLAAGGADGVASVLFYMTVYVAMTLGAFLCVLQMRDRDGHYVETIASLSGLSSTRPGLAAAFAIFMFSLAGIPPLFGFWPKFLVFSAAVKAGLVPLAVIGMASSVIGAFYYLKIVKTMYFDEPAPGFAPSESRLESGLIAAAAIFVSPLGYLAIPALTATTMAAARALFCGIPATALPIRHVTLAETGSTNDAVAELAAAGEAEGLWLRAERQTAGRGRRGREWASSPGNLHVSSFVRLRRDDPPSQTLALVAATALHDAAEHYVPAARLTVKWPNDLLLSGMKLAGILLERIGEVVVLGFGVNLASHPADLERPATSLAAADIDPPAPGDFAQQLAEAFANWLSRWRTEGLEVIREAWLARAHPVGMALVARLGDGEEVAGAFDGLAEDGALRLRLVDGTLRTIHAADVFTL